MIYLDHHAATPLALGVREAMAAALDAAGANPSSVHAAGRKAHALLDATRRALAAVIGAEAADVVLTSGGTEACNLGVLGLAEAIDAETHVITTGIEHPAMAEAIARLEIRGAGVTRLFLPGGLAPAPDALARAIEGRATLVALQWVNHETGTLLPIAEYAAVCAAANVPLVVDATQALGKVTVDLRALGSGVTALAFAASKLGGPAGAGALWIRRGVEVAAQLAGGAQEHGRRPGTPDVVAHAGFGASCGRVPERLAAMPGIAARRDRLEAFLRERGGVINGDAGARVATVVDASLPGVRGDQLVAALDVEGLCASSGAACSSGLAEPSPVIAAMHPDEPWRARAALRLSLGPETRDEDVAGAIEVLARVLDRIPRS